MIYKSIDFCDRHLKAGFTLQGPMQKFWFNPPMSLFGTFFFLHSSLSQYQKNSETHV